MIFLPDESDLQYRKRLQLLADEYGWNEMPAIREEIDALHIEWYSPSFQKKLADAGLVGLTWPEPHGKAARVDQQFLMAEELECQGFRGYGLATNLRGGGMLLRGGSEEQISMLLPHVVDGSWTYCQGLSEPGAGSDLLLLKTKAVRDGDHFVINGAKPWTSSAHTSKWCSLLVRTDPEQSRHPGLSLLLVDLKSPGVTIQPVWVMGGWRVNAVFYDGVRVPVSNLVGAEHEGWKVITENLDEEQWSPVSEHVGRRISLTVSGVRPRSPMAREWRGLDRRCLRTDAATSAGRSSSAGPLASTRALPLYCASGRGTRRGRTVDTQACVFGAAQNRRRRRALADIRVDGPLEGSRSCAFRGNQRPSGLWRKRLCNGARRSALQLSFA